MTQKRTRWAIFKGMLFLLLIVSTQMAIAEVGTEYFSEDADPSDWGAGSPGGSYCDGFTHAGGCHDTTVPPWGNYEVGIGANGPALVGQICNSSGQCFDYHEYKQYVPLPDYYEPSLSVDSGESGTNVIVNCSEVIPARIEIKPSGTGDIMKYVFSDDDVDEWDPKCIQEGCSLLDDVEIYAGRTSTYYIQPIFDPNTFRVNGSSEPFFQEGGGVFTVTLARTDIDCDFLETALNKEVTFNVYLHKIVSEYCRKSYECNEVSVIAWKGEIDGPEDDLSVDISVGIEFESDDSGGGGCGDSESMCPDDTNPNPNPDGSGEGGGGGDKCGSCSGGSSGGSGPGGISVGDIDAPCTDDQDEAMGFLGSIHEVGTTDYPEINASGYWFKPDDNPSWNVVTKSVPDDYSGGSETVSFTAQDSSTGDKYYYERTGDWTSKDDMLEDTKGGIQLQYITDSTGDVTKRIYDYDYTNNRVTARDISEVGGSTKYMIYDGFDPTESGSTVSRIWAGTNTSDFNNGGTPAGGRWMDLGVDTNGKVTSVQKGGCSECARNYTYVEGMTNRTAGSDYDPDDPETYTSTHYLTSEIKGSSNEVLASYKYDHKDRVTSHRLGAHSGGAYLQVTDWQYEDAVWTINNHDPDDPDYDPSENITVEQEGADSLIRQDYVDNTNYRAKVVLADKWGKVAEELEFHDLQSGGTFSGAYSQTEYEYYTDDAHITKKVKILPLGNKVISLYGGSTDGYQVTKRYRQNAAGDKTIIETEYDYTGYEENNVTKYLASWSKNASGGTTDYTYSGWDVQQIKGPDPGASPYGSDRLTTNYSYDSYGRMTQEIADGDRQVTTKYIYDYTGNLVTQIGAFDSADAVTTVYQYNEYNDVTKVIDPEGNLRETEYANSGAIAGEYTYEAGSSTNVISATTYDYDNGWLVTKKVALSDQSWDRTTGSPSWTTTLYQYDAYGRRTAVIADLGDQNLTTSYEYDNQSDVTKVTRPDGSSATTVRDGRGLVSMAINTANGNSSTTNFYYDLNGNLIKKKDPEGVCEYYEYDGFDRRIRSRRGR